MKRKKRSQDSALLERAGGRRRSDFRVGRAGREKKKKMKEKGKGKVISGARKEAPCIMISEGKGQKVNLNLWPSWWARARWISDLRRSQVRVRALGIYCMYVCNLRVTAAYYSGYAQCSTVYIRVNVRLILLFDHGHQLE